MGKLIDLITGNAQILTNKEVNKKIYTTMHSAPMDEFAFFYPNKLLTIKSTSSPMVDYVRYSVDIPADLKAEFEESKQYRNLKKYLTDLKIAHNPKQSFEDEQETVVLMNIRD